MTIQSSQLVSVTPSVLAAGGLGINALGLFLTTNSRVPIGTVLSFPSPAAVLSFFGPGNEANQAAVYFTSFEGAQQTPSAMLFVQYPTVAVAAYLRGINVASLTLAQLQAISGALDITVDGYARNVTNLSLTAATSFSSAAGIIATALNAAAPSEVNFTGSVGATFTGSQSGTTLTTTSTVGLISVGDTIAGAGVAAGTKIVQQLGGTPGGNGTYQTTVSGTASTASCTASSNVLDVTNVSSGTLAAGQSISGAGLTEVVITGQLGGATGGIGTYSISGSPQQVASESMTSEATPVTVTFDSQSGAFVVTSGVTGAASSIAAATGAAAISLGLTALLGAVTSQGAIAAVPSSFMTSLLAINQNWVSFTTLFNPDGTTGLNVVKQQFAAWKNTALGGNRFMYVCWDNDITATQSVPATGSLGFILNQNGDSGTYLQYQPTDLDGASFVMGMAASINFSAVNGRVEAAFKAQAGLTAGVSDPTIAVNLAGNPQAEGSFGNGYNYYGAYAQAGQSNIWEQRGTVTGPFQWFSSYINQIVMNNFMSNALLTLFGSALSVPFTAAGLALLATALGPIIQQFLAFGAFSPGTITTAQAQQIFQATGNANAANTLSAQGWFLFFPIASTGVRTSRGPQPIIFYYLDNGAIQSINLSSVAVTE